MADISDYFGSYPDVDEPDSDGLSLHEKLTLKREFAELKTKPKEKVPEPGKPFNHQELARRNAITWQDSCLHYGGTGLGKSKMAIYVTEHLKKFYEEFQNNLENMTELPPYNKVYVLVRGPSLIKNFRRELMTISDKEFRVSEKGTVRKRTRGGTDDFYNIMTYGDFAKQTMNLSDEQIIEKYSGSVFVVDEVHNTRIDYIMLRKKKAEDYNNMHRVFHLVKRSKIYLYTATPIVNKNSDFISAMNLILPLDKQLSESVDYTKWPLEKLYEVFKGRISYIREMDTGIDIQNEGEPLHSKYHTIVYKTQMSKFQSKYYLRKLRAHRAKNKSSTKKAPFSHGEREASNFVFPDGSFGQKGFQKYIKTKGSGANATYEIKGDFRKEISDPETIRKYSSKFADVIDRTEKSWERVERSYRKNRPLDRANEGVIYSYSDVKTGSGCLLLSICYQRCGYKKFVPGQYFKKDENGVEYLDTEALPKAKRYVYYSPDTLNQADVILKVLNCKENMHGEYIKAIVGSMVTREGISIKNATEGHLITPGWHMSSSHQALSRIIRATSHVDLSNFSLENGGDGRIVVKIFKHCAVPINGDETSGKSSGRSSGKRKSHDKEDDSDDDSEDDDKENKDDDGAWDPLEDEDSDDESDIDFENEEITENSVDILFYLKMERKDRKHAKKLRIVKSLAFDARIHQLRNVRKTDRNGGPECDYVGCGIDYFRNSIDLTEPDVELDDTTYDIYYCDGLLEKIKKKLIKLFKDQPDQSLMDIMYNLSDYQEKYVERALERIIFNKEVIINQFGQACYLTNIGDRFFLQSNYPTQISDPYYSNTLVVTETVDLNVYAARCEYDRVMGRIQGSGKKLLKVIDSLSVENKIRLFEAVMVKKLTSKLDKVDKGIRERFSGLLYKFKEPVGEIIKNREEHLKKLTGKRRGRKAKNPDNVKPIQYRKKEEITFEDDPEDVDPEMVYIHVLSSLKKVNVKHGMTQRIIKMDFPLRILKPSEGRGWRDMASYEKLAYNKLIQLENFDEVHSFDKHPIHGILYSDGVFKIRDQQSQSAKAGVDKRRVKSGRNAKTYMIIQQIDILWRLKQLHGMTLPKVVQAVKTKKPKKMRKELALKTKGKGGQKLDTSEMDDEKLKFFYKWMIAKDDKSLHPFQKEGAPEFFKKYFEKHGLMKYEDVAGARKPKK